MDAVRESKKDLFDVSGVRVTNDDLEDVRGMVADDVLFGQIKEYEKKRELEKLRIVLAALKMPEFEQEKDLGAYKDELEGALVRLSVDPEITEKTRQEFFGKK